MPRYYNSYAAPIRLARRLGGMIIFMEMRFFGASNITDGSAEGDELCPTADRLGLLSVEQVLADYTRLLSDVLQRCGDDCTHSAVITFGGSLAGTLAALMRLRASWLVDFAWASSSPLFGFDGMPGIDQYSWRRQVTDNWRETRRPSRRGVCACSPPRIRCARKVGEQRLADRPSLQRVPGHVQEGCGRPHCKHRVGYSRRGRDSQLPARPLAYSREMQGDAQCAGRSAITQWGRSSIHLSSSPRLVTRSRSRSARTRQMPQPDQWGEHRAMPSLGITWRARKVRRWKSHGRAPKGPQPACSRARARTPNHSKRSHLMPRRAV